MGLRPKRSRFWRVILTRGICFCSEAGSGDQIKMIWWDGQGACLFTKRLERGRFVWPGASEGKINLSRAQLAMLMEGIDWRMPQKTWRPADGGVIP